MVSECSTGRARRRHASACAVVVGLMCIASCSPNETTSTGDVADAYAVVVRWFTDRLVAEDEPPVVFVESRGEGLAIGLELQAAIVAATEDFAKVRFIDDRSEALDSDGVRDGGIFLALGPAVADGSMLEIECDEIVSATADTGWTFQLVYRDQTWELRRDPVRSP